MKIGINKYSIILTIIASFIYNNGYSQDGNLRKIEYTIVAEGIDSPIKDLQLVCYNKYFNLDSLPAEFREKNNLNEKGLYKKKMLIEIFRTDNDKKGLDKIELVGIRENEKNLVIEYNLVNSNENNDNQTLAPFLIVQVPKSKKAIKFIVDGIELGKGTKLYVD